MPKPEPTPVPRSFLLAFFAAAAAFLYLRTFLLPATPLMALDDQTMFFARAVRMVHGQMPYRDFFEMVTPGTDLLYAATFRIFGVHAWIMQAWAVVLGLAFCIVVTWIASKILRGPMTLLPALLFLIFDYNNALDPTHHWYSTLAALLAAGVLCDGTALRRIASAGALCGVSFLFTQTTGGCALLALVVYLLWSERAHRFKNRIAGLAVLILSFSLVAMPVLGYYGCRAGFGTLWFDLAVFPVKFLSTNEVNSPRTYLHQLPAVHSGSDVIRLITFLVAYLLVPYIYFAGLYLLRRQCNQLPESIQRRLVLLNVMGIAIALAVASGPRFHRICTIAAPAFLVVVWMIARPTPVFRAIRATMWGLTAAFAVWLMAHRQMERYVRLDLPTGHVAVEDKERVAELQWLTARIRPGDGFFNEPVVGLYLGLDNPAPVDFVNDNDSTRPEQVSTAVQALAQRPPRFLVTQPAGPPNTQDHSAPYRQFVSEHYHLAQTFSEHRNNGSTEVWELQPATR